MGFAANFAAGMGKESETLTLKVNGNRCHKGVRRCALRRPRTAGVPAVAGDYLSPKIYVGLVRA